MKYIFKCILSVSLILSVNYISAEKLTCPEKLPALDSLVIEIERDVEVVKGWCENPADLQSNLYRELVADGKIRALKTSLDQFPEDHKNLFDDYWQQLALLDRHVYELRNGKDCNKAHIKSALSLFTKHHDYLKHSFMGSFYGRDGGNTLDLSGKNGELKTKLDELLNPKTRKICEDLYLEKDNGLGDLQANMKTLSGKLTSLDRRIEQLKLQRSGRNSSIDAVEVDYVEKPDLFLYERFFGEVDKKIGSAIQSDTTLPDKNTLKLNKYNKACFGEDLTKRGKMSAKDIQGAGDSVLGGKDSKNACILRHEKWQKERDFWISYTRDASGTGTDLVVIKLEYIFETIKKINQTMARSLKYISVVCENQSGGINCLE